MNNIFNIFEIESNGTVHFTFNGDVCDKNSDVILRDLNSGLVIYRTSFKLSSDYNWWVSVGDANVKWLRNVEFILIHNDVTFSEILEFPGHGRFLVVNGEKLTLETIGDNGFPMASEIFYDRVYERDFVRISPGDVVMDIGANYGLFSLYSQNFAPKIVYAVEPFIPVFKCLVKNTNKYNIVTVNKSISDEVGYAQFGCTGSGGHNYLIKNADAEHASKVERLVIVETTTINELISDHNIEKIDFLKIDCEGAELDLFKTIDREFLRKKIHKIALEYHSNAIKNYIIGVLVESGFTIEHVTDYSYDVGYIFAHNLNKSLL